VEHLDKLRIELVEQGGIIGQRQIENLAALLAAKVIVRLAAAVVARRAVIAGDAVGQTRIDERFQRLVHRGQADVRKMPADGGEHLLGRGMALRRPQIRQHRRPLARVTPTRLLQHAANVRILGGSERRFTLKRVHALHFRETKREGQPRETDAAASELPLISIMRREEIAGGQRSPSTPFQGTRNLLMTALRIVLSLATGLVFLAAAAADEARGRIVQIDPDKKQIRLETRRPVRGVLDVKIDAKTQILIGGQPATLTDLAPNRRIRVVFEPCDGKPVAQVIRALNLNLAQPQPAARPAPPKDGEGVAGTLQRIGLADSEIVVIGPGPKGPETETTLAVPEGTAITRDGKKIALDDLKEGEVVTVKTESRKGKLTAVSIQVGQAAAVAQPPAPPRRELIPRLRQALKMADELLREMEDRNGPSPDRP
jgi:hypothetical protein